MSGAATADPHSPSERTVLEPMRTGERCQVQKWIRDLAVIEGIRLQLRRAAIG